MKIFKKAISLVLVFAMLASFAGMTGYSPLSIKANAVTNGIEFQYPNPVTSADRPRDTFAGQNELITFDVPPTLYTTGDGKVANTAYGVNYDTVINVTVPGAVYTDYSSFNNGNYTTADGSAYGGIVANGNGLNRAYVRLNIIDYDTYTNGDDKILYTIALEDSLEPFPDGLKDSSGKLLYPKRNAQIVAGEGKIYPVGNDWGLEFDISGQNFNTTKNVLAYRLDYIVPQYYSYDGAITFVADTNDLDGDGDKSEQVYVDYTDLDRDGNTNDYFYLADGKNNGLTLVWDTAETNYDNDWTKDSNNNDVPIGDEWVYVETKYVMYHQYAASYVETARSPIVGFNVQIEYSNRNNSWGAYWSQTLNMYQRMDISDLYKVNGVVPFTSMQNNLKKDYGKVDSIDFISTNGSNPGSFYANEPHGLLRNLYLKDTNTSNYEDCYFVGDFAGNNGDVNGDYKGPDDTNASGDSGVTSYFSMGFKVYFDSYKSTRDKMPKTDLTLMYDTMKNKWTDDGGNHLQYNDFEDTSRHYLTSYTNPQKYEYYAGKWNENTTFTDSAFNVNSAYDKGTQTNPTSSSIFDGGLSISGNIPVNIGEKKSTTADYPLNVNIDFSKISSTSRARYFSWFKTYTLRNSGTQPRTKIEYTSSWHFDFIAVNRDSQHKVIDLAVAANYVKAEMPDWWWQSYRTQVLKSYLSCGNLTGSAESVDISVLNKPTYIIANNDALLAEIQTNAAYEVGNYKRDKYLAIDNGDAWGDLGNKTTDSPVKTGAEYYTAETWDAFVRARAYAYGLVYGMYDLGRDYNYELLEDFGDVVNNRSFVSLHVYMQERFDEAAAELKAAREGLKLKTADYTKLINAVKNNVVDGSDTNDQYIANNGSGAYNSTDLKFYVQSGDYTGEYYLPNGTKLEGVVSAGMAMTQDNFANSQTLRDALNKRLAAYEIYGSYDRNKLAAADFQYYYSGGTKLYFPAKNTLQEQLGLFNAMDAIAAADAVKYESYINANAKAEYLPATYQTLVDAAAQNITDAAAALKLQVNLKALADAIEAARYDADGDFIVTDKNVNGTGKYILQSFNQYKLYLDWCVKILRDKADQSVSSSTSIKYNDPIATIENDYSTKDPVTMFDSALGQFVAFDEAMTSAEIRYVDTDGAIKTATVTNRQQEYNYAVLTAQNVKKLLRTFADYTEALKRVNNSDETQTVTVNGVAYYILPEFDQGGKSTITGFTGEQWYTADTWNTFVDKRNALAKLLLVDGAAVSGYTYANGAADKYTRGNLTNVEQTQIDTAVAEYDAALAALQLKTMSEYTDSSNKTYDTLNAQVETMLAELAGKKPVFTIENGELNEKGGEVTKFKGYAELEAVAATVKAIEATENLVDKYAQYEAAINSFNNKYNEVKAASEPIDESGWLDIFEHLSMLVNGTTTSVTPDNILAKFVEYYVDSENKIIDDIEAIMTAYSNVKKGTHLAEGEKVYAYNSQDEINAQVKALYTLLSTTSLPAKAVSEAIESARNEAAATFIVYNPYNLQAYSPEYANHHPLYNAFGDSTPDGIAGFVKYTSGSIDKLEEAIGKINNSYNLLKANVAEINTTADTLLANAGLKEVTNVPCLLVEANAKMDILKGALDGAVQAIDRKVTAVNPADNTQNIEMLRYTAKSNAELKAVYEKALAYYEANATETTNEKGETVITTALTAEDQIEIDKLVFMLLDEIEDSRLLLSEAVDNDHWTWKYYDAANNEITDISGDNADLIAYATCEPTNADYFTKDKWNALLHEATKVYGKDNGLVLNKAYYNFLINELKTPYVDPSGLADLSAHWDKDGWAIVGEDGKVSDKSNIFDGTWGTYVSAYNKALDLYNDYINTEVESLTADQQAQINTAAENVYITRNALQLLTFKFDKDDMYDDVQAIYNNTLLPLIQKVSVMRYGYEYVLDENGERTGAIQPSADPKSSAAESVYLYNNITPELEALIDRLYVEFASNAPTANFGAWGTEDQPGEGLKLYNQILELTASVTPKSSDDASLVAGMEDLKANYIAGVWTPSTQNYTSDLLNNDQVGKLDEMLTEAQNYITPAANATADRVASLMTETTKIFNYTTAQGAYQDIRATDLQFAEYMREEELFAFMELTVSSTVLYYYGGTYEIPMFNEVVVAQYKSAVETFFNKLEWPCIYEINGLKWSKGDKDHAASITGYGYENGTYTGSVDAVVQILNQVGSRSPIYAMVAAAPNTFNADPYNWLCQNAFKVIPGTYSDANKRGDETVLSKYTLAEGETYPKAYNAGANWYTEGYAYYTDGGNGYYLYSSNTNGTWFTDITGVESNREDALLEDYGYTIGEMLVESDITGSYAWELGEYGVYEYYSYADYLNDPSRDGWKPSHNSGLVASAEVSQEMFDYYATALYDQLCALQLRPATEAYRDVYNTYLSVMGEHIADGDWDDDKTFSSGTTTNVDFKFYNVGQVSKITGMYSELKNDAVPPYGIVLRSMYPGFTVQYMQTEDYSDETNNPWYNLVYSPVDSENYNPNSFINKFISTPEAERITIDQAAKVNSYNVGTADDDNYKSIMETLIDDYLSQLEFDDLVFDKLDAVVAAFLGDKLPVVLGDGEGSISGALRQDGFTVGVNYGGKFYPLSYYKEDSLLEVAAVLRDNDILAEGQIIVEKIGEQGKYMWSGETFPASGIEFTDGLKGTFYTSTTDQNKIDSPNQGHNSMLYGFLNALNTQLELKSVKIQKENNNDQKDYLTEALSAAAFAKENEAKYDKTHTSWGTFETEYANAQALLDNVDNYNITHQELFDNQTSALLKAIENLQLLADNYAPSMTLKTSVSGVKDFYSKGAYAVQLSTADPESYKGAGEKPEEKANPAAGTFFVPNSSGYSLIVYTNELNPRIVINLEDLEQKLAEGTDGGADVMQDAAKKEFISINAVRTSGVVTNVIAGTIVPAQKENPETMSVLPTAQATSNSAVTVENASTVKGSSAFAILAPKFVEGTATQAALYTIEARDGSVRSTETGTVNGNNADQFEFGGAGQEPVDIVKDNNGKIAIYIYYYSLKAEDGTDEGINADGSALATPAINGTHVPSALLSGEPGFKGADWRNGILLQRHFSDSHRVWEYVSEVKKNKNNQYSVNGTIGVPVYNDPNFGYLNTGSFYYVLDRNADANTVDGKVIAEYNSGNDSVAGCMDYDRATAAKTAMIKAINAMTETEFAVMKKSGRFYNYGDYYTNEYGEVLKYDNGEPQWVNWSQSLNNKVENGDLVFVHVVDRWGNVVNRIVEITNLDEYAPSVNSAASGAVTIMEDGGSGIADIQVHNGDFSLGEFEYQISQSQNVKLENGQVTNKAEVNCASNVLTIINLVPGKTYYIGAEDKAGNRGTTAVKADANGHIAITIENEFVQTGEDMGFEGTSTFTLNGTDTIILNSGDVSSVINADIGGNVFANRTIRHYITTTDSVTALKTVYQDGTVEEYTAENATVKNNGDGTLTWTIKRKLTEGEHTYKVYAKTNGAYENFYALAVINATTRTVKVECTNVGQGATVLTFSGSLSFDIANYVSKEVPYGAKVTISATAYTTYEGCEFYYWINNTTDRIINTSDVYEFKAVANADYIAQFTNNSTCIDGKKFVIYVNNAKNVIERFELADGENYTVPTGPVLPDYTFKGWSMTKAEVLASDKNTIIVEPIYELNVTNTVTITEGNYTATGAGIYAAEDNERAVVTISTSEKNDDGQEFLYWIDADTNEKVSYSRTYTFFCVKDTELTPVYGDASSVKAEPIVRITEVKFNALSGKVSFFAERSVPEDFVILQTGIVVTKTETIGTNEDVFVVGGASTAAGTSTSTANNGFYSANTAVATGQTVWARAYVIYETADGEIFEAYGPVVSYTVD